MSEDYPDVIRYVDMTLVSTHWECECEEDFVHLKAEKVYCDLCESNERESPDARLESVAQWFNSRYG